MTPARAHRVEKLLIAGAGLIGASFALALRAAGQVGTVVGIGRGSANLEAARLRGAIDRGYTLDMDWAHEAADADLVLLAAPVSQYAALFATLAPHLGAHTVLTDAGSTKQDVVDAARRTLGVALPRFVPAHPIAGSEQAGAKSADARMFVDRSVIVTPLEETSDAALAFATSAWATTGARVTTLSPARHDRLLGATSHLPHLLAFTFVDMLAGRPDGVETFAHAGSGLRDFTRIAASSPPLWRDIFLANRAVVREELAAFQAALAGAGEALEAGDGPALEALFARAAAARHAWSASASYPRRPGAEDEA